MNNLEVKWTTTNETGDVVNQQIWSGKETDYWCHKEETNKSIFNTGYNEGYVDGLNKQLNNRTSKLDKFVLGSAIAFSSFIIGVVYGAYLDAKYSSDKPQVKKKD